MGCGDGASIRIAAASSLSDVLPAIVERYEHEHPGVSIEPRFAGSQLLATQIEEDAPVDLFLSANPAQAERAAMARSATRLEVFAANRLVVAVTDGSRLYTIEDLAEPGVRIAMGAASVPVGALTEAALASLPPDLAAGIRGNVITRDPNVRVVLSRLELGEADAVFVYEADLEATSAARRIDFPDAVFQTDYVAVLLDGDNSDAAAFLEYLLGAEAQALLAEAGFVPRCSFALGRNRGSR